VTGDRGLPLSGKGSGQKSRHDPGGNGDEAHTHASKLAVEACGEQ